MSINLPIPQLKDPALYPFFIELLRRAVDGTVVPVFVTTTATGPQVVIGGTVSKMGSGNASLDVVGQAHFDAQATFWNNVLIQRNISISGNAQVAMLLEAGSLLVAGQITANGLTITNGSINIGGGTIVVAPTGSQLVGNLFLWNDLTVRGNLVTQKNLSVSGTATVSKNLACGSLTVAGVTQGIIPVGTITMHGALSAPPRWLLCDGTSYLMATKPLLFAMIGTTYGSVDGTHFNVPDMRGVFPKGAGTTTRAAGQDASGNSYAGTLGAYATDKMQGHYHANNSTGGVWMRHSSGTNQFVNVTAGVTFDWLDTTPILGPITDGTNGTPRTGHTTEPQSLGLNFIIYAGE